MDAPKKFKEFDCSKDFKVKDLDDHVVFCIDDEIMSLKKGNDQRFYYFIYCAKSSKYTRKQVIDHITSIGYDFEGRATFLEAIDDSLFVKRQVIRAVYSNFPVVPWSASEAKKLSILDDANPPGK